MYHSIAYLYLNHYNLYWQFLIKQGIKCITLNDKNYLVTVKIIRVNNIVLYSLNIKITIPCV